MSSKQGRSCIDPVVQSNMEGAMGTVVPTGLPKADSLPHYSHDKALPISRAYFPYAFGGQDTLDFPSPWGPSKTCMRNGPGPGIHSSAAEGSVPVRTIYRPDKVSFPVDAGGGRCAVPQELAAKQRLAYYASSPRQHSPRAAGVISPVPVPKGHNGGSDAESCVGLAIPKPVYGHSPCCTERGCTAGHYGVEHGPQRMSPRIYDEEWAAHFSRLAYLHKKGQEAFAQQRVLQLEHGTEGIKDGKTESYHDPPDKDVLAKRPREELEMDMASKRQKIDSTHELSDNEPQSPSSPLMPVINKVFSLAPYKVYFEATGMLSSLGNSNPQPEATLLKQEPEIQNCDLEPNSGESDLSLKQDTQMSPANSDSPVEMPETVKIKKEKLDPDEVACQSEIKESTAEEINHQAESYEVKEEQEEPGEPDTSTSDSLPCHVVVKSDFEEERNPFLVEKSESLATCKSEIAVKDNMDYIPVPTLPSTPTVPPQLTKFSLTKIPPHCLKLANFKIVIPEVLKAPVTQPIEVPQSPLEAKPIISSSKHARHQFMELHQSLCRLIYCCVNQTPCQELRDWLCRLDLQESGKDQKVSCLLGSKMREVWLKGDEMEVALKKVVFQLQKYVESRECPFPHVIRAGAVFIPMLVVKEVLFPQVQGAFIDQVLQEHRVELRPTTLTEERQLTHLHRKAFSSKLRRLLSLKHLPDIYPDVLNLLYHANVCKFLDQPYMIPLLQMVSKKCPGVETSLTFKSENTDSSDESAGCVNGAEKFYLESSRPLTPETTCVEKLEKQFCLKRKKKKGRVKISSKRTFLEETSSSSQEEEFTEEPARWSVVSSLERDEWEVSPVTSNDSGPRVEVKIEDETQEEPENSAWGRPLTSDDFSSDSTDEETESTSLSFQSRRSSSAESQGLSKGPSSMVLKLRKVFYNKSHGGRVTRYQKITDSLEAPARFRRTDSNHYRKKKHKSSRHKRRRTDREYSFSPFLSKKHCRRWVLRSAVQSAHLAMENRYPDLVGKRIRHLYEENDKTEVWYRGVVLRIHEPHSNPLKTVFEVKYDSEPEWQYYLELLLDYKKGWLKVED
ncbi:hypothetical protein cypCar_00019062 [Cyprinus carpio]|nr:hypothetical protein cypCar_00019062 [Cyprinus carpio]